MMLPGRSLNLALFTGLALTMAVPVAADVPDGIKDLLSTALSNRDRTTFDTVFNTALQTWPEERLNLFQMVQSLNPSWLSEEQAQEVADFVAAEEAAEAASRARGVWYYLDPALWNGQVQVGANVSSGDTDQQAGSLGLSFQRNFGPDWEHALDFKFDFARRSGETVQERFVAKYDGLYRAWEKGFIANFTQIEVDRFSGFDYRLTETVSVGYQLVDNDRHKLRVEAGPGFRINRVSEEIVDANGVVTTVSDNQTEIIGRLAASYDLKFSETVSFNNTMSAIFGSEFTSLRNLASLSTKLTSSLALRLSFEANYDSPVPVGTSAFDTITRATIAYDF